MVGYPVRVESRGPLPHPAVGKPGGGLVQDLHDYIDVAVLRETDLDVIRRLDHDVGLCAKAASKVCSSRTAKVIGPTPPGTRVISRTWSAAASRHHRRCQRCSPRR